MAACPPPPSWLSAWEEGGGGEGMVLNISARTDFDLQFLAAMNKTLWLGVRACVCVGGGGVSANDAACSLPDSRWIVPSPRHRPVLAAATLAFMKDAAHFYNAPPRQGFLPAPMCFFFSCKTLNLSLLFFFFCLCAARTNFPSVSNVIRRRTKAEQEHFFKTDQPEWKLI